MSDGVGGYGAIYVRTEVKKLTLKEFVTLLQSYEPSLSVTFQAADGRELVLQEVLNNGQTIHIKVG
jgi:hypothetical protein